MHLVDEESDINVLIVDVDRVDHFQPFSLVSTCCGVELLQAFLAQVSPG